MFISVGNHAKLAKFLELNPKVNPLMALTDESSTFEAYQAVGFGKIGDNVPNMGNLGMPKLSGSQMWLYASNMMQLSPVDLDDLKAEVPQGVLRLGGTFVIDGEDVVYAWSDSVPGDTPSVDEVLKVVGLNGIDLGAPPHAADLTAEEVVAMEFTVAAEPATQAAAEEPAAEAVVEAPAAVEEPAADEAAGASVEASEAAEASIQASVEEEEEPLAAEELAFGSKGKKRKNKRRKQKPTAAEEQ